MATMVRTVAQGRPKGLRYSCLAALAAVACSVPPEQPIVGDFFAASRLRDLTALSKFSTVVFEPKEQGTVARFHIVRVLPLRVEGDRSVKQVDVAAEVRVPPDGHVVEKALTITLQKRTREVDAERTLYDGWIVTGVTDAPASPATPRS